MGGWADFYLFRARTYAANPTNPGSWKTLPAPPPSQRADLGYQATYTEAEYAVLAHGFLPQDMDERWFIVLDDGWLKLYRSWTGMLTYALHLKQVEGGQGGWTVDESWVSRNPDEYAGEGPATESERNMVTRILRSNCFSQHRTWLEVKAKDEEAARENEKEQLENEKAEA